jgi:hypothetical protein
VTVKEDAMLRIAGPKRGGRRGASLVEMTLVTFFLLVLLVGIIDFGRAFYTYIIITNASREGARYGSRFSHHADGILEATRAEAKGGGVVLAEANIDIDPYPVPGEDDDDDDDDDDGTPAEPGEPIVVTVTYDIDTILGHIVGFETVPLRARTEMVVFWTQGEEG